LILETAALRSTASGENAGVDKTRHREEVQERAF